MYRIGNKYISKVVFQKKQYHLGTYKRIEDAAEVRRKAEAALFDEFTDYYARYRSVADMNPGWEQDNPIRIHVDKDGAELSIQIMPDIKVIPSNE